MTMTKAASSHNPPGKLYATVLLQNGPSVAGLASVDTKTGVATPVGGKNTTIPTLLAPGDLAAMDTKTGILYLLGDSEEGATLTGVRVRDGKITCTRHVPFLEVGFVGMGQALAFDAGSNDLVAVGLANDTHTGIVSHTVVRGSASACGPFKKVGSFGDAHYLPLIHGAAFDDKAGVLYTTVTISPTAFAVMAFDMATAKSRAIAVPPGTFSGIRWDPLTKMLCGVVQAGGSPGVMELNVLDPKTGKLKSTPLGGFDAMGGNDGEISAFDAEAGTLYVVMIKSEVGQAAGPGQVKHLVPVYVREGAIGLPAPPLTLPALPLLITLAWDASS